MAPTRWTTTWCARPSRATRPLGLSLFARQNLVKGGGGALLREKMVEVCAKQFIVIVDESKLCPSLGPHFPIPVEIVPFCHEHTVRLIAALPSVSCAGCTPKLRMGSSANNKADGEEVAITDNGNYIVDLHMASPLPDAALAAKEILDVVGVVEHGLFVGLASSTIIAGTDGIREIQRGNKRAKTQ